MKQILFAPSMLAGEALEAKKNQIVIIENGKFVSIGNGTKNQADIVLQDKETLMPGLIDCHTHLALDARIPGHLAMMEDPEANQTVRALKSAADDLQAGITGLRCLGDRYYIDVLLRNLEKAGQLDAPWMQVAGIGMKGLHGHGYVGIGFSGPEEFRRQSRENIFHQTDWLKIFITPGTPPVDGTTIQCFLSREEVRTVVQEAKACGLKTSSHCLGGLGLQYCTEEGIDVLDHCYWADEKDIDLILKYNSTVCLTPGVFMDDSRLPLCPPLHAENVRKTRNEVMKRLSQLIAAHPKIVIGSDAYHGLLYRDVMYAVDLGMNIKEALKGVTVYAGELMSRKTGQITEGYDADCIVVEGNPLKQVSTLANVRQVIRRGKKIR